MVGAIGSSSTLSAGQLQSQVGVAVAKKAQDQMRQEGAAVVSLLESASTTQRAMVSRAMSEPFKGTLIDVVA